MITCVRANPTPRYKYGIPLINCISRPKGVTWKRAWSPLPFPSYCLWPSALPRKSAREDDVRQSTTRQQDSRRDERSRQLNLKKRVDTPTSCDRRQRRCVVSCVLASTSPSPLSFVVHWESWSRRGKVKERASPKEVETHSERAEGKPLRLEKKKKDKM